MIKVNDRRTILKSAQWYQTFGKEEIEMKHLRMVMIFLFFLSWGGMGCKTIDTQPDLNAVASPGKVLGVAAHSKERQKIVTFDVIGKGLEPENAISKGEAILMAERAAVADGYRRLVEKISGVYVDAYSKAGFGTVNRELITTKAQSWLRGVDILELRQGEHGIVEARMQLSIYFSQKNMVWWPTGLGPGLRPMEEFDPGYPLGWSE